MKPVDLKNKAFHWNIQQCSTYSLMLFSICGCKYVTCAKEERWKKNKQIFINRVEWAEYLYEWNMGETYSIVEYPKKLTMESIENIPVPTVWINGEIREIGWLLNSIASSIVVRINWCVYGWYSWYNWNLRLITWTLS